MSPEQIDLIKDRARILKSARQFFSTRNVTEIDCQMLRPFPAIDAHVEAIETEIFDEKIGYLHTSPEYQLKRLLAEGMGDIYYLGHVFRKNDFSLRHEPEFTMAEWYRIHFTFEEMIEETVAFLFLFIPNIPIEIISYQNVFFHYLGIDITKISLTALQSLVISHGGDGWDLITCRQFLLSHCIEPKLGQNKLTIITDFPEDEAALAVIEENVAKRFEIYHEGIELANGYKELKNADEIRKRFEKENERREKEGKNRYALDEAFLQAMQHLPECCGVSVGFDRAFMLRHKKKSLSEVIATSVQWELVFPCQMLSLSLSAQ